MKPALLVVALLLAFGFVGNADYADALTQDAIRKDPPRILSYTIKQDSPGLDNGERMFPLRSPVTHMKLKKGRRK